MGWLQKHTHALLLSEHQAGAGSRVTAGSGWLVSAAELAKALLAKLGDFGQVTELL